MLKYLTVIISIFFFSLPLAQAERLKNETALLIGLDKITGRTQAFNVKIGETYQFGTLDITPRVCYTSSGQDPRGATAFLEINENQRKASPKRIFNGWMFASSPALNALDHPIYDIWLTGCETPVQQP